MPKVGILPLIDGWRREIRELLEDQIMRMVKEVAKLYTKKLRHSNGEPMNV